MDYKNHAEELVRTGITVEVLENALRTAAREALESVALLVEEESLKKAAEAPTNYEIATHSSGMMRAVRLIESQMDPNLKNQWGVWCVEDRGWCMKGTREEAEKALPEWASGRAADVDPNSFHYEIRRVQVIR